MDNYQPKTFRITHAFSSTMDLLEAAQDAWIDHAGGSPPDWRLKDSTIASLKESLPGAMELKEFIKDSVAAWIWSHEKEENIPFMNLNTSLLSESNTRRLEAYRACAGNSLSRAVQTADEVLLSEQEWLQWLGSGELPDFEYFKPCAAWIMASSLWRRPLDQLSNLKGRVDDTGHLLGKTLQEITTKTRTKEGCEVFLRTVQPPLIEALETYLSQRGLLILSTTDDGPTKRFLADGVKELLETANLRKRDILLAQILDVTPVPMWLHPEDDEDDIDGEEGESPTKRKRRKNGPLASQEMLQQLKESEYD